MTYEENLTAVLECYFSGFKKEITNSACNRIQELNKAIFDKGYNEGTASDDGERGSIYYGGYGDGHKDGLNDAWECVRKICNMDFKTRREALSVNPNHESLGEIVNSFSVSDAISKIKEYEEKLKENNNLGIEVGDEVVDGKVFNSGKGIVTFASPLTLYVLWYDGSTGRRKLTDVKKTGKHFDQIAKVLEEIGGE